MALTNAEKQAAHRAKKDALLEQISQELATSRAENEELREKVASLEKRILTIKAKAKKLQAELESHTAAA